MVFLEFDLGGLCIGYYTKVNVTVKVTVKSPGHFKLYQMQKLSMANLILHRRELTKPTHIRNHGQILTSITNITNITNGRSSSNVVPGVDIGTTDIWSHRGVTKPGLLCQMYIRISAVQSVSQFHRLSPLFVSRSWIVVKS